MIGATMILEDMTMQYQHAYGTDAEGNTVQNVTYTVTGHAGETETVKCSMAAFEAAMTLCQLDGECKWGITPKIYSEIEDAAYSALPVNPNLRWVP